MGVVIRQSLWSSVSTYLGIMVGYVNTLYFRLEYFELDQNGVFALVTANAMILSPFCLLGLESALIKFFPKFEKKKQENEFFSLIFFVVVIFTIILVGSFIFSIDVFKNHYQNSPEYVSFIWVTLLIVGSNSLFEILFSYCRTQLKIIFGTLLRDLFLRLGSLFLIIGFAARWYSFETTVQGLGIIYCLAVIFLLLYVFFYTPFRFKLNFSTYKLVGFKSIARFALYSMMLSVSIALLINISYSQVSEHLGAAANGIYTTCLFIGIIVEIPRRNMSKVLSPLISKAMQSNDMVHVGNLYKKSSITLSVIAVLISIGILTNIHDLLLFIPKGDSISLGIWVVASITATKTLIIFFGYSGEIINYSTKYIFNLAFLIVTALLMIILNETFIPLFGLKGAALSYFIAYTVHALLKYWFIIRYFKITPFLSSHLLLLAVGGLVGLGIYYLPLSFHPLFNIIIRSVVTTIIFTSLIYYFKVSEDINQLIRKVFSFIRNLKRR